MATVSSKNNVTRGLTYKKRLVKVLMELYTKHMIVF